MTRVLAYRRSTLPVPVGTFQPTLTVDPTETFDLTSAVDRVRNQANKEDCAGHGRAAGIHVAVGGKGKRASARGIWTGGRVRERARKGDAPQNVGVDPFDALLGCIEAGVFAEDDREDDPAFTNVECDWEELRDGVKLPPDAVQAVEGGARAIKAIVRQGFAVDFAMNVTDGYNRYDGSGVWMPAAGEESRGGHDQVIVGYGPGYLLTLGSWGAGFGRMGYALIADEFFDTPGLAFDKFVTTKGVVLA